MFIYNLTTAAGAVVERLFPPRRKEDVCSITTALNLLNAIVKLQEGKLLTSYNYIKGMVACQFVWLWYHPVESVELDWNEAEDVTYIRIDGVQYSFHYVPLVRHYVRHRGREGLTSQRWDGIQRQGIAAELFRQAVGGSLPEVDHEEAKRLLRLMGRCSVRTIIRRINALDGIERIICEAPLSAPPSAPPSAPLSALSGFPAEHSDNDGKPVAAIPQRLVRMRRFGSFVQRNLPDPNRPLRPYGEWKAQAYAWRDTQEAPLFQLALALKFNGWWERDFTLTRKGDKHVCRVAAYRGDNYSDLVRTLMGHRLARYIRPERFMRKRWLYYIRRDNWSWAHVTYTRYLLLTGHYNNLLIDGRCYNLCITYGLARYLSAAYPQLRFINVLNFTRFKVRRRVYTANDLQRIGLHSQSRRLKVWMVVDPLLLLANLDLARLPPQLVEEYRNAQDYDDFFRKEWRDGRVGLVAYSRYHLLPPVYRDITFCGHYAHVMNSEGRWAVYSLMEERFETDFVFSAIYYDPYLYMVVGCRGAERVIIHDMFNPV